MARGATAAAMPASPATAGKLFSHMMLLGPPRSLGTRASGSLQALGIFELLSRWSISQAPMHVVFTTTVSADTFGWLRQHWQNHYWQGLHTLL